LVIDGTSAATKPSPQHAAEIERLHAISVEIASLQELPHVMDRALDYCLELTASEFGFVGLMQGSDEMDVAAIKGFVPDDQSFYAHFRSIPVRPSVFGVVVLTGEAHLSNDVAHDALHVGTPHGHPPVRTFLGIPLVFGAEVLGMLGVANRQGGYDWQQERLLSVFANQVAVAIRNARLYEEQRNMIARLQLLRGQVEAAERDLLLDAERQRIARELHDRVAQTFFSIGLAAQSALEIDGAPADSDPRQQGAPRQHGDPRQQIMALESIRGLSAVGNEQMREAIFALSRADLQDRGLVQTLWTVVRAFRERTGLEADLVLVGKERPLPPEIAEALLAVVREALVNVEQHARATSVIVTLRTSRGGVTLAVQDDGIGAPALLLRSIGASFTHFGLRGLQERIRKLGGSFTARNGEDGGLVVRARVPVHETSTVIASQEPA
jgi:signal transduction histidine kinase